MSRAEVRAGGIRFGPFEVDRSARILRKRGLRIRLRRQSFDILAALLERPGEVVTREELRRRLWPDAVFVEFEDSLNSAVKRLRRALGDSAATPQYIETVPRVGYRFGGRVAEPASEGERGGLRMLVLPFSNLSGDPAQEYLSDGLTEEVTGQLAAIDARLAVIARTSAMHYKGSRKGIAAISRELNLDYVLEGSVRRRDGRVRVAAQLIDARRETHLWANNFEGELTDIIRFQCDIAQAVASEIRLEVARPAAANVISEAYDAYIQGIFQYRRHTPQALTLAVECLERATAIDPRYAKAWARLGVVWADMGFWTYAPGREAYSQAERAARRALELDKTLAEAHEALAAVNWFVRWDMRGSEREYRWALDLNPSSADARWGLFAFLASMKSDFAEAALEARRARELDPLSATICVHTGWMFYWSRQYARAISLARRALEMDTRSVAAYQLIGSAQLAEGRSDESIEAFESALTLNKDLLSLAYLATACAAAGQRARAEALLDDLESRSSREYVPYTCLAVAHMGLGNHAAALDWLEKAFDQHDTHVLWLRVSPRWDALRGEPRFTELIRRLPLPEEVQPSSPRSPVSSPPETCAAPIVRSLGDCRRPQSRPRYRPSPDR